MDMGCSWACLKMGYTSTWYLKREYDENLWELGVPYLETHSELLHLDFHTIVNGQLSFDLEP